MPDVDVIVPIRDEHVLGLGQPDDAVDADQDTRDDNADFDFDVALHLNSRFWFRVSRFPFAGDSGTSNPKLETVYVFFSSVTNPETALRATWSFMLSGLTRSIRVSSLLMLTMVPTKPPVVSTTLPF